MRVAKRVENLPPYLFAELDKRVAAQAGRGRRRHLARHRRPRPAHARARRRGDARRPSLDPQHAPVPLVLRDAGAPRRRSPTATSAASASTLDPDTEVLPLIGSKEGIAHIAVAFVDPGDRALVPDPGYPVYGIGTILAGGEPVPLPLTAANRFLPDFDAVATCRPDAKIMWLSYPSNPTAAVADADFSSVTVAFAPEHDLLVCHDAAYVEITFDGYVAPSILQVAGREGRGRRVRVAVEDVQHDRLAHRVRRRQRRGHPDARRP